MGIVVQKYGGSSLCDIDHIKSVAERIKSVRSSGDSLIVVASAMCGVTNELLDMAHNVCENPNIRELDALLVTGELQSSALLAIALNRIGVSAVSLNAYQLGLLTTSEFGDAKVVDVDGNMVVDMLKKYVIVVPGFQGIDCGFNFTTLGRGGSDLTALVLAKRFEADRCEIFSDVDGVYVSDPKVVPTSKFHEFISHSDLLRLSLLNNKVMHDRSVAFAQQYNINFTISSSTGDGTKHTDILQDSICAEHEIAGITYKTGLILLRIFSKNDIFRDVLDFFNAQSVALNFVKSTNIKHEEFLCEVAFESKNCIHAEEILLQRNSSIEIDSVADLVRIDIAGCDLQRYERSRKMFDIINAFEVQRYEYGKFGFSFLIQSKHFEVVLRKLDALVS